MNPSVFRHPPIKGFPGRFFPFILATAAAAAAIGIVCGAVMADEQARGEERLFFPLPQSPSNEGVLVLFLGLVLFLAGTILYLLRVFSDDAKAEPPPDLRRRIEGGLIQKMKNEFEEKQKSLDQKLAQVRNRTAQVIHKIRNLSTTLEPKKVFSAISDLLKNEIGVKNFILFLNDRETEELYPFQWEGFPDNIGETLVFTRQTDHLLTLAFNEGRVLYKGLAETDPRIQRLIGRPPLPNVLVAIPLMTPSQKFGVIHVESFQDEKGEITSQDLQFFSGLSTFMGMALENAEIYLQTRSELTSNRQLAEREIVEKKKALEMLSRYTSPELAQTLLRNPHAISPGGKEKTAAIMFVDLVNTSGFRANHSPEEAMNLMNSLITWTTQEIVRHQGEVDKFLDGAILARFGVLFDLPNPAGAAVKAALAILRGLNDSLPEGARDPGSFRFAIATGKVLAGNIGSEHRMEYSVIGPTVSLAIQLLEANKEARAEMLVDEATFMAIVEKVTAAPRELFLRGSDQPMVVYEIHVGSGNTGAAPKEAKGQVCPLPISQWFP